MSGWINDNWSLQYLPPEILNQLADALDVDSALGLGFSRFAGELCINNRNVYSVQQIQLIRERSQPGSKTLALLYDYGQRGGTMQGIQRALESIGHVASQIIPNYLSSLALQIWPPRTNNSMYPQSPNSGLQNTCNCPTCIGQNSNINEQSRSETRDTNVLSGSVYTGSSRSRKNARRNSRTSSVADPSFINSPPVTGYVREDKDQTSYRRETCHCEECRLRLDPDQTQRFTLESDPKIVCSVKKGPMNGISETNLMPESVNNIERLESGLSRLYLDSYESEETSLGNSDETQVKSVFGESQRFEMLEQNVQANHSQKLCSRSDNGEHRLGEMPETCSVCRQHTGARPKSRSRGRYNSATDKNSQQDTALRKSWHGTSKNRTGEELLKSWSDSSLINSERSNAHKRNESNAISETLYSRISSGTGGFSGGESTTSGNGSVQDVYENNLESGIVNNSLTDTRNIVPSDSSNFTDIQNPLADSQTRTRNNSQSLFNPFVPVTNAESDGAHQNRQSANSRHGGPKVFVTYGWNRNRDSESFMQEVIDMCLSLREKDVRMKIDMDDHSYSSLMLNKLDWIDKNVREARYIIVCITPTYAADIREPDRRNQASPRVSQLNARYIYDKLREEYYNNSAQNRRIIPVIFSNHQTSHQHVPDCMRSTLIYEYPNDIEKIIAAILGHGRFRPS